MKYSEIIQKNKELDTPDNKYKITILSNIMVHQAKEICEFSLRKESVNADVYLGDYDNIVQDSSIYQDSNSVIIFWELYNLVDGLQYKIELLSDEDFINLVDKVKMEIDIVFNNLKNIPLIIINKFSTTIFQQRSLNLTKLDKLSIILNKYIDDKNLINLKVIDLNNIFTKISIDKATELRFYYMAKTLYSIEFYKEYFNYVKPIFLSVTGKVKKAIIFDCDNTLWKGILGEDGFDNIKMFQEVQYLAMALAKQGIIIGLCSKNNYEDVDMVLKKHNDMILTDEFIVIKKINWNDKVSNIKSIAKELNIGLDSLVFIDDSSFEVNLVKEKLPMVSVFQVPSKEYEYSMMMRGICNLFYNSSQTKEDIEKIQMYKAQIKRVNEEQNIGSIDDYLKSLQLEITFFINELSQVTRISQMTQKTNQFNLTTKRYTHKEIENYISKKMKHVITIQVSDKFGDNGIVGLAMLDISDKKAKIDTFLMSCRVLGRNIEYKFMDIIIDFLKKIQIETIESLYIETLKNKQVSTLYEKFGFQIVKKRIDSVEYSLNIKDYISKNLDYIGVKNGK